MLNVIIPNDTVEETVVSLTVGDQLKLRVEDLLSGGAIMKVEF